jgi:hypothetical protein
VDQRVAAVLAVGEADVEAFGPHGPRHPVPDFGYHRPHLALLLHVQVVERLDMPPRRHYHVADRQRLGMRNRNRSFGRDPGFLGVNGAMGAIWHAITITRLAVGYQSRGAEPARCADAAGRQSPCLSAHSLHI